jgi:hypothetical protein
VSDNVTLPAIGTGTATPVIATNDVAGVQYQRVKLDGGGDGATTPISAGGGTEAAALRVTLASDSTGLVSVDDNGASLTVDAPPAAPVAIRPSDGSAAQTFHELDLDTGGGAQTRIAIGLALAASGGSIPLTGSANGADVSLTTSLPAGSNNIGDVDVLTVPADPFGLNADSASSSGSISAKLRFIAATGIPVTSLPNVTLAAGTNTNEVVGDVAHSAAVSGNPVLVCGVAQDQDDTAPPNRVDAESDATRIATDRDGTVFVHPFGPQLWSYHENSSSTLTDATVKGAPGAGLSLYVTSIVVSTGAATAFNIFFEEGASTVLGPWYLEAVAGRGFAVNFLTPKKITANTALTVTTSAAIAHSIDVTGYTAQG